jgi:predicted alpha-1,2-mannosidase
MDYCLSTMGKAITAALLAFLGSTAAAASPSSWVDPFIGTAKGGNTYPGAQVPWGMVSVSPHTDLSAPSGYYKDRKTLYGFGHVHISGAGCTDLGNVVLMPTTGVVKVLEDQYKSEFAAESASPGYYRAQLTTYGITAEATATTRAGMMRLTYPAGAYNNILFDMSQRLPPAWDGAKRPLEGYVRIISKQEIEGWTESGNFCGTGNRQVVYFVARVSKPVRHVQAWNGGKFRDGLTQRGTDVGAVFRFSAKAGEQVVVKVGVSYVNCANARANLNAEIPGWDFDTVRRSAVAAWDSELGKISVEGGTEEQRRTFYTALYHCLIHPSTFSDVNGQYRGFRNAGPGNAKGYTRYHVYSLWDTYRNLHPLLCLAWPERQLDMVKSMVEMYREGGWLPKWELAGGETLVMVGDPAAAVIGDTFTRGIRGFDADKAMEGMLKSAREPGNPLRPGLEAQLKYGWIPQDLKAPQGVWGPVSTMVEYGIADHCIAKMAEAMGRNDIAAEFAKRAVDYRNCFDAETGFLRPRNADGSWVKPFSPALDSYDTNWYVEGNAWQYSFPYPYDFGGYASLMGGEGAYVARLQECVDSGQFVMWNEPDFHYPWLFDYANAEGWRTQKAVREALARYFRPAPDGIPGNDDAGTSSAWAVFAMMGLYPACPGDAEYQLASPVFDRVTITLNPAFCPGGKFVIETTGNSPANMYIKAADLDGEPLNIPHIRHGQLVKGGVLALAMTGTPAGWGGIPVRPSFARPPAPLEVDEGAPASFSVAADGTGPLAFRWLRNGSEIPGAAKPRLDIPSAGLSDKGARYSCEVSSPYGSAASAAAILRVRADRVPPELVSALRPREGGRKAILSFSEPVTVASAEAPANYRIDPGAAVESASLLADSRTVILSLSSDLASGGAAVTVRGVRDRSAAGNEMSRPQTMPLMLEGDGLGAEYFGTMDLSGEPFRRVDPVIDFDWKEGSPAGGVPAEKFSVRWTGKVRAEADGTYYFTTFTDDGVRLWVDGKLLVDAWTDQRPSEHAGEVALEAGKLYDLRMEYFENGYLANATLYWTPPRCPREVVPARDLYSGK